jgi:hypothetical protein
MKSGPSVRLAAQSEVLVHDLRDILIDFLIHLALHPFPYKPEHSKVDDQNGNQYSVKHIPFIFLKTGFLVLDLFGVGCFQNVVLLVGHVKVLEISDHALLESLDLPGEVTLVGPLVKGSTDGESQFLT